MKLDQKIFDKYQPVIGLEVHVQLLTKTKIFAGDKNKYGSEPNHNVSVITLGHPGTMPRMNKLVMRHAIKMGMACGCDISKYQVFDRKNYFYPDLPKGYQTTQDATPVCIGGKVAIKTLSGDKKEIILNRIHMEEDAGKSIHQANEPDTLVDYNRAGVPLIEIVTEPMIQNAEEAAAFLGEIRKLVRYLEISDGNMEEGSMRCDANVSVMLKGASELGKKAEVKNMNSIRNVSHAINHEIERQITEIENGHEIISETRTFDVASGTTSGMRTKEELNDYRYFPEPDLSPMEVTEEFLTEIKAEMPALPHELVNRFVTEYQLPEYDAYVLTDTKEMAAYFQQLGEVTKDFKTSSNWLMGTVKSYLNDQGIDISQFSVKPNSLGKLINAVKANQVSQSVATQKILPQLIEQPSKDPIDIAKELNLIQDSNSDSLKPIIDEVLLANPDKVSEYKKGRKGLLGMFVGEVMKKSKGKADPKMTNKLLKESLEA